MKVMEQERVKLRRDYELVLSELASVLYVDDETISLKSLKHKVWINLIIIIIALVVAAAVVINELITVLMLMNSFYLRTNLVT